MTMLLTGLPGSPNTTIALPLLEAGMVAKVKGFPGFIFTCNWEELHFLICYFNDRVHALLRRAMRVAWQLQQLAL